MRQEEVVAVSLTIEVTAGYRSITFVIRGDLDLATAADLAVGSEPQSQISNDIDRHCR
jgi:hypothetical protein